MLRAFLSHLKHLAFAPPMRADKWADRGGSALPFYPVGLTLRGRPTYRLSVNRRGKVNASRFVFLFPKLFPFAPPFGGQVGGPRRVTPYRFMHRHTANTAHRILPLTNILQDRYI
jgi:hypothetical protein